MTNSSIKPPIWFWIVSVLAFVWNAMGVNAYLQQAYDTEAYRAMYPPEQIEFVANQPSWVTAAFAIAVFGGLLGCIGLLLRKQWAGTVFILSFIAVIIQFGYYAAQSNINSWIMTIMVFAIAIFLIWFAKKSKANGWLS